MSSIYSVVIAMMFFVSDLYLFGDPLNRQTFRGSFVLAGPEGREPDGKGNNTREVGLQEALFALYQNSELRSCFVSADILALDR